MPDILKYLWTRAPGATVSIAAVIAMASVSMYLFIASDSIHDEPIPPAACTYSEEYVNDITAERTRLEIENKRLTDLSAINSARRINEIIELYENIK